MKLLLIIALLIYSIVNTGKIKATTLHRDRSNRPCLILGMHAGSVPTTSLKVSENNGSSVFVELLRGRDGLPGRDGVQGSPGLQGKDGSPGPPGPKSGGATYTRWGKSTCPQVEGTELVYSGIAAGTFLTQQGGGANYLCMPKDPEYSTTLRWSGWTYHYTWSRISVSSTRIT